MLAMDLVAPGLWLGDKRGAMALIAHDTPEAAQLIAFLELGDQHFRLGDPFRRDVEKPGIQMRAEGEPIKNIA